MAISQKNKVLAAWRGMDNEAMPTASKLPLAVGEIAAKLVSKLKPLRRVPSRRVTVRKGKRPPKCVGNPNLTTRRPLLTTKCLANILLLHPRTVKRWWKTLNVPPMICRNGCHRWTWPQVRTLVSRWRRYQLKHRHAARWRNGKASSN